MSLSKSRSDKQKKKLMSYTGRRYFFGIRIYIFSNVYFFCFQTFSTSFEFSQNPSFRNVAPSQEPSCQCLTMSPNTRMGIFQNDTSDYFSNLKIKQGLCKCWTPVVCSERIISYPGKVEGRGLRFVCSEKYLSVIVIDVQRGFRQTLNGRQLGAFEGAMKPVV